METKGLGRVLKLIRTYHQLKQNELAEKLGISNSYLSEIETGKKDSSISLLEQYSRVFEIPVSHIILLSEHVDESKEWSPLSVVVAKKALAILDYYEKRLS
jgi:transcriptional regulator with XRE-family HTH domain